MNNGLNSSPDGDSKSLRAKVLSGSFMLLAGSGSVTVINFLYNIAVARSLGPSGFGHVSAVCTLLILISAVTLSFQIVSAKIVAQQESLPAKRTAYRGLHWRAWVGGILAGVFLLVFRNLIAGYLNLPGPVPVTLMAIGAAFYVPLGSRRGYLQGSCSFRHLALNVVAEGIVRLGGSLLAIKLGYGVTGVIGANVAAVVMAYLAGYSHALDQSGLPSGTDFGGVPRGIAGHHFLCRGRNHQQFRHRAGEAFLPAGGGWSLRRGGSGGPGDLRLVLVGGERHVSDCRGNPQPEAGPRRARDFAVAGSGYWSFHHDGALAGSGLDLDHAVWRPLRNGRRSPLPADALRRHHQRFIPSALCSLPTRCRTRSPTPRWCNWLSAPS